MTGEASASAPTVRGSSGPLRGRRRLFTAALLVTSSLLHVEAARGIAANDTLEEYVVRIRRELHRVPETCYEEHETSKIVLRELRGLDGVEVLAAGVASTGVVARVGSGAAPVVILRADIDGLPIHERPPANLPEAFAPAPSTHPGRSHACGHDGHAAMLLGAAKLLTASADVETRRGTVLLVFQPAEEGQGGMERMLREGALLADAKTFGPRASSAFALHIWPYPYAPTGTVLGKPGPIMVASAAFRFVVKGRGGHAAIPNENVDAVLTLSTIVAALQSIVSRETSPRASAVVSVTTLNAGGVFNVLPDEATAAGTFFALSDADFARVKRRIEDVVMGIAAAHGCNATIDFRPDGRVPYPVTANDPEAWRTFRAAAAEVVGNDAVRECDTVMTGEDFGFLAREVPSNYALLGAYNPSVGATHALHSPEYVMDESVLAVGARIHAAVARRALSISAEEAKGAGRSEL